MLSKMEALKKAHVAIIITPLKSSKAIVSYQADQYMTPASNTKLLTFLASVESFDSLPALYYHDKDSITHFKSTGYPLLLHPFYPDEELYSFLKGKNYLVYHKPKSNLKPQGPGWSWDDYSYYFASEISPFPIYGNVIQGFGDSINQNFVPNGFETHPTNNSSAANLGRKRFKNRFHYNSEKWNIKDTLYQPFITSDDLFVNLLSDELNLPVSSLSQSKRSEWELLYTHKERKLYKALLQDSDNGIAESLLVMISQKRFGEMNIERTIDTLKLQWRNWLPDQLEWVDGSGVSRYNMITPRTVVAVLKKIYKKVGFQNIKNYFPKGALSGTLKEYDLKNIYAKTGTLRHNHNLSGYLVSSEENIYVFSVMVNHHTSSKSEVRNAISQLLHKFQKRLK